MKFKPLPVIYLLFALGFVFLVKGADFLVEGASAIAKRFHVSDLAIGLTIVSLGTSAPELVVNIVSSFQGAGDIGIGNVLGSNIANILLILGVAAVICPMHVKSSTVWKEIPFSFLAALLILAMANDVFLDGATQSILSRSEGMALMAYFILFMYYAFGMAKEEGGLEDGIKKHSFPKALTMTLVGIVGLTYGGKWVVDGAVAIASMLGLSQALIGLTIVAIGTSLPELATSAVAAYKKKADIAIGNVVGSNIFNILWVLGLSSTIRALPFSPQSNVDILMVIFATLLLFGLIFIGKKGVLSRREGFIFLACYASYIVFLVMRG